MLKQRFLVQFGSSAITQILGVIAGLVVARVAGPGVMGLVSYGTAYVSLLGFITGLFGSTHIKLINEGRDHADCMTVFTRLYGLSMLVYFAATAGWFLTQKYLLHYSFESKEMQIVIVISLFSYFFAQYEQYGNTVFTANLKQAKANIPPLVKTIIWHLGRIVIVLLGYRAIMLASWNLILCLALVPVVYNMLKVYPLGKYDREIAKIHFKLAPAGLIIVVVNSILHNADKLLLANFTNTIQLGYYSAALAIGGAFRLIAAPVGQIFFPLFSALISKGDWASVNSNIFKYHEFIILFILPATCVLAIAGGPVMLLILGSRYQPSIRPISILLMSTYVILMGLPYGNILSGMGRFYLGAWVNVIKLFIFVLSMSIFVSPKMLNLGATGLALNTLLLSLAGNGLYLYFARKFGDVRLFKKNNLRQVLIFGIAALTLYPIHILQDLTDWWWVIMALSYILIVYVSLIVTKLIGFEQVEMLLGALNLKKTLRYISNELKDGGKNER